MVHIETVGCNDIRVPAKEILRLGSSYFTDRCEAIRLSCGGRFHGIFRFNVMGARFRERRYIVHVRVYIHPRTGEGSSENRCVRRKYGAHFGNLFFHTQEARAAHPFMELGDCRHVIMRPDHQVIDRFDHFTAGVTEHQGFHVVPSAGYGIYAVILPEPVEQLVLVIFFPEVDEDDLRLSGNLPPAKTARNFFDGRTFPDLDPAILIGFFKIRVRLEIRSQKEVPLTIVANGLPHLAGNNGIYSSNFIAYLPADLK